MSYRPVTPSAHGRSGAELYSASEEYLRRIAEAVERIADAVAGPAVVAELEPLPTYPLVDQDNYGRLASADVAEPHIVRSPGGFYYAVCTLCPGRRDRAADPAEPSTLLEHEDSSGSLDDMRAALVRHLAHHDERGVRAAALPIWTWADRACPRCGVPAGTACRTTAGRASTSVHSARWTDHSSEFW